METILIIAWLGFCVKTALKGKDRKIGFTNSFTLCLLLTPIVGKHIIESSPELHPYKKYK